MEPDEIAEFVGADSLGYLSEEGMLECVAGSADRWCTACWSGRYPVPIDDGFDKMMFEKGSTGGSTAP